jgi:hypothetical protein
MPLAFSKAFPFDEEVLGACTVVFILDKKGPISRKTTFDKNTFSLQM